MPQNSVLVEVITNCLLTKSLDHGWNLNSYHCRREIEYKLDWKFICKILSWFNKGGYECLQRENLDEVANPYNSPNPHTWIQEQRIPFLPRRLSWEGKDIVKIDIFIHITPPFASTFNSEWGKEGLAYSEPP